MSSSAAARIFINFEIPAYAGMTLKKERPIKIFLKVFKAFPVQPHPENYAIKHSISYY
jgi:hypothetical protein